MHTTDLRFIALLGLMRRLDRMPTPFQWLSNFNYLRFSLQSTLINSYGFGRCAQSSSGFNRTSFLDLVSDEKLLSIYASDKINVEMLVKIIDSVLNGIIDEERSLIMMASNLTDNDYFTAIPMLFVHIAVYRCLTYFFIIKKIRSRS